MVVADQHTGKESCLAEDLEAVADTENKSSLSCKLLHRPHYWREPSDGTRSKVVTVGKPAGYDDAIIPGQISVLVPDIVYGLVEHFPENVVAITVAPGAWEDYDAKSHGFLALSIFTTGMPMLFNRLSEVLCY